MPRRIGATLMVSMMLGGCYVSTPLDGEGTSGSRLRRIVLRPESGEPFFMGWHDRELEVDCAFATAADGAVRCLPLRRPLEAYYLDEGCSQRVGRALEHCERATPYRYDFAPGTTCDAEPARIEVFELEGEVIAVDRPYELRDGACVASETAWPRVRRAMPVDPARFVGAEVIRGESAGAIARDRLVADDGARQRWRWRDTARDVGCAIPGIGDLERAPCTPDFAWRVTEGGPRCDERWAIPACSAVPEIGYSLVRDGCADIVRTEVYTVHEAVPEPERMMAGEECSWAATYEARRAQRDDDAVPWVTREWRGAGRLQLATWIDGEGGALGTWGVYHDRELGSICVPQETADGLRCVPGGLFGGYDAYTRGHFADSECTEPATGGVSAECDRELAYELGPIDGCPPAQQLVGVYRVREPLEVLYRIDAETGACTAQSYGGHALERIPLSALARFDRVIE